MISKPLIVNRLNRTVRIWNSDRNEYTDMTFECIEDVHAIIKDPVNHTGIIYEPTNRTGKPVNISAHPLVKKSYELCLAIEELPASTDQTNLSVQASALTDEIWNHVNEHPVQDRG